MKKIKILSFLIFLHFYSQFSSANQCTYLFNSNKSEFSNDLWYINEFESQNINGRVFDYYDEFFGTRFYIANIAIPDANGHRPIVDADSNAVVLFLHGSGTMRSSGKNFLHIMNFLSLLNISSVAIDFPFHGDGPNSNKFEDPKYFMNWMNQIVTKLKSSGKKVYLVGHSFGPSVAMQYMYDYPFGVDGALLISPVAFNKDLRKWYNSETAKMKFGDAQLISHTMGGVWGDLMLSQFSTHNDNKGIDPTLINSDLKVNVLTGDHEEYAPAPLSGRKNLPFGKNTYSIPKAILKLFSRAEVVLEEGVGHYIFKHTDENGENVVNRELLKLLGIERDKAKSIREANLRKLSQELSYEEQLWYKFHSDSIFRSWALENGLEKSIRQIYFKAKSNNAKNILEKFRIDNERKKTKLVEKIINKAMSDPNLVAKYENEIKEIKVFGLRYNSFVEAAIRAMQRDP